MLLDEVLHTEMTPGSGIPPEYLAQDWPQEWAKLQREINKHRPVPFEVSNVADYFYLGWREHWDLDTDFPGAIPPFEHTWMEWVFPKTYEKAPHEFERVGCSLFTEEMDEEHLKLTSTVFWKSKSRGRAPGLLFIRPSVLMRMHKRNGVPIGRIDYALYGISPDPEVQRTAWKDPEMRELGKSSISAMMPAILAMSLLNCRNVKSREVKVERQQRRHAERHNIPIIPAYHVIEIQPFISSVTRATGKQESGFTREAAKIVRGHFKDYTQGEGLFGHIKERFWWAQQLRGPVKRDFHYEYRKAGGRLDKGWLKRPAKRRAS